MKTRNYVAIFLCMALVTACVTQASAGLIAAIVDKHKSNPEGLHAKIKQKKALSDHQPLLKHHGKK